MPFLDLSHEFYDGTVTPFGVSIKSFITHEQPRPRYRNKAEFEIPEMQFHTSMGTYLDAPYHRWRDRRDIGDLTVDNTHKVHNMPQPGGMFIFRSCAERTYRLAC